MASGLRKVPWFVSAPAIIVGMIACGVAGNLLVGVYFERTTIVEANPLSGLSLGTPGASTPATPAAGATPGSVAPIPAAATAPGRTAELLRQGRFKDGAPGHSGSGTAKIGRDASGKLVLVIEDFSVTNGPDLHVILGPNPSGGGSGLDLGKLKATDGTFSYGIPEGTDLSRFKSITIWCQSFPTIFAYATLEG